MRTEAFLIAILVAGGSLVHAQSLGEAAAKEKVAAAARLTLRREPD
jgi:hypothetical protein